MANLESKRNSQAVGRDREGERVRAPGRDRDHRLEAIDQELFGWDWEHADRDHPGVRPGAGGYAKPGRLEFL